MSPPAPVQQQVSPKKKRRGRRDVDPDILAAVRGVGLTPSPSSVSVPLAPSLSRTSTNTSAATVGAPSAPVGENSSTLATVGLVAPPIAVSSSSTGLERPTLASTAGRRSSDRTSQPNHHSRPRRTRRPASASSGNAASIASTTAAAVSPSPAPVSAPLPASSSGPIASTSQSNPTEAAHDSIIDYSTAIADLQNPPPSILVPSAPAPAAQSAGFPECWNNPLGNQGATGRWSPPPLYPGFPGSLGRVRWRVVRDDEAEGPHAASSSTAAAAVSRPGGDASDEVEDDESLSGPDSDSSELGSTVPRKRDEQMDGVWDLEAPLEERVENWRKRRRREEGDDGPEAEDRIVTQRRDQAPTEDAPLVSTSRTHIASPPVTTPPEPPLAPPPEATTISIPASAVSMRPVPTTDDANAVGLVGEGEERRWVPIRLVVDDGWTSDAEEALETPVENSGSVQSTDAPPRPSSPSRAPVIVPEEEDDDSGLSEEEFERLREAVRATQSMGAAEAGRRAAERRAAEQRAAEMVAPPVAEVPVPAPVEETTQVSSMPDPVPSAQVPSIPDPVPTAQTPLMPDPVPTAQASSMPGAVPTEVPDLPVRPAEVLAPESPPQVPVLPTPIPAPLESPLRIASPPRARATSPSSVDGRGVRSGFVPREDSVLSRGRPGARRPSAGSVSSLTQEDSPGSLWRDALRRVEDGPPSLPPRPRRPPPPVPARNPQLARPRQPISIDTTAAVTAEPAPLMEQLPASEAAGLAQPIVPSAPSAAQIAAAVASAGRTSPLHRRPAIHGRGGSVASLVGRFEQDSPTSPEAGRRGGRRPAPPPPPRPPSDVPRQTLLDTIPTAPARLTRPSPPAPSPPPLEPEPPMPNMMSVPERPPSQPQVSGNDPPPTAAKLYAAARRALRTTPVNFDTLPASPAEVNSMLRRGSSIRRVAPPVPPRIPGRNFAAPVGRSDGRPMSMMPLVEERPDQEAIDEARREVVAFRRRTLPQPPPPLVNTTPPQPSTSARPTGPRQMPGSFGAPDAGDEDDLIDVRDLQPISQASLARVNLGLTPPAASRLPRAESGGSSVLLQRSGSSSSSDDSIRGPQVLPPPPAQIVPRAPADARPQAFATPTPPAASPAQPSPEPIIGADSGAAEDEDVPVVEVAAADRPARRQTFTYTDLDVLLSRLENAQNGEDYDDLHLISEILGSARTSAAAQGIVEELPVGRVETVSRRVDKQGKVKQKLEVVGVRCNKCTVRCSSAPAFVGRWDADALGQVCLLQFRPEQLAVVLPCLHVCVLPLLPSSALAERRMQVPYALHHLLASPSPCLPALPRRHRDGCGGGGLIRRLAS